MEKHQTHVHVAGRTTDYIIPNSMGDGQHIMMTKKGHDEGAGDVEMDDEGAIGLGLEEDELMAVVEIDEDVEEGGELEVEDDGDLDSF